MSEWHLLVHGTDNSWCFLSFDTWGNLHLGCASALEDFKGTKMTMHVRGCF